MMTVKPTDNVRKAMLWLQERGQFQEWFKEIVKGNLDYLRKENDSEANITELRKRQGAIKLLCDIIKQFESAWEDLNAPSNP